MKTFLLVFTFSLLSVSLSAQENTRQNEVGILFSGLDNFGIGYKIGTKKAMWRFNTLVLSGASNKDETANSIAEYDNLGFSFRLGREFRKELAESFELRYGGDLYFGYHRTANEYTNKTNPVYSNYEKRKALNIGGGVVFGFNYVIKESLVIGAELLPLITFQTGKNYSKSMDGQEEEVGDISGISFGISNTSALLSISYRF
jgi:hypothetical protein